MEHHVADILGMIAECVVLLQGLAARRFFRTEPIDHPPPGDCVQPLRDGHPPGHHDHLRDSHPPGRHDQPRIGIPAPGDDLSLPTRRPSLARWPRCGEDSTPRFGA